MPTTRPLGPDQKYLLSMVNPEWITGSPTDGRSLRGLVTLEQRGLVQQRAGRWAITDAGRLQLEKLRAAGEI